MSLLTAGVILAGCAGTPFSKSTEAVAVLDLRTEYKVDPLDLDVVRPRLSWRLQSNARGTLQTIDTPVLETVPNGLSQNAKQPGRGEAYR